VGVLSLMRAGTASAGFRSDEGSRGEEGANDHKSNREENQNWKAKKTKYCEL